MSIADAEAEFSARFKDRLPLVKAKAYLIRSICELKDRSVDDSNLLHAMITDPEMRIWMELVKEYDKQKEQGTTC